MATRSQLKDISTGLKQHRNVTGKLLLPEA